MAQWPSQFNIKYSLHTRCSMHKYYIKRYKPHDNQPTNYGLQTLSSSSRSSPPFWQQVQKNRERHAYSPATAITNTIGTRWRRMRIQREEGMDHLLFIWRVPRRVVRRRKGWWRGRTMKRWRMRVSKAWRSRVTWNTSWSDGRSRLEVRIIKIFCFIFWSNKWHTIFLLMPFIGSLRICMNWRRGRSLRHVMTHGGREASHIIMKLLGLTPVHSLINSTTVTHSENPVMPLARCTNRLQPLPWPLPWPPWSIRLEVAVAREVLWGGG